jgi:hypothetical protein
MTAAQPNVSKPKRLKSVVAVLLIIAVVTSTFTLAVRYGVASSEVPVLVKPEPQLSGIEEKGWQFIKTVIGIDTSKYNVTVKSMSDVPPPSFATPEQIAVFPLDVMYDLNSTQSTLTISCSFIKGNLVASHLYLYTGTVLTHQPLSSNLTEAAVNFLTAYQNFSGRNLTGMLQTLGGISLVNGSTVQLGDLKFNSTHRDLTGTAFGDSVDFRWVNIYSGCEYWALQLSFQDGHFGSFIDNRQWYQVGDTTVNVSGQQAIDIALDAAEGYSYKMSDDWWVSDFNITRTEAILYPQSIGGIWYPCWTVNLYFDKTYPGSVHGIIVFVWAGSGEIEKIGNIAYASPDQ